MELTSSTPGSEAPSTHCIHTSPGGGGTCGTLCDEYCYLAIANCTGATALFATDADCRTVCDGYAQTGQDGDATGDSVQCRISFLLLAATDPATNCPLGDQGSASCM